MPPLTQQYNSSFGQGYPTYLGNTPGLTSSSKVDGGDDINGPLSTVASMASVSPSTIESNTPTIEPRSDSSPSSFTTHLHQWGVQRPLSSYEEYNPMYPMRLPYQDTNYNNAMKTAMLPTQPRNISHAPYSNSPYDSFYLHTPNQDIQTNVIVPPFQQPGNGVFLQQGGQPRSLQSFGYPQMSTLKQDLRQDLKSNDMHTNQKYKCPNCFKSFLKPYNLKSHMKTHSDARPYRCSHCSKSFARSHDRKRHELLHDGEKKFMCEGYLKDGVTKWGCEKKFMCEGYLKDGVTKWGCGKKFARSDALSRHFRTETGWACIMPLMNEAKQLELDDSGQSHPLPFNLIKIKNEVKNRQDHSNS